MQSTSRWIPAALAAAALLTATFAAGFATGHDAERAGRAADGSGLRMIEDAYGEILETSVDPPSERRLARGAVKGMIKVLNELEDDYATFFTPRRYRSLRELQTGEFTGIGVWLKNRPEGLTVASVLPKTPALAAGVRPGDVIRTIDGRPVAEMTADEAVEHIKGPSGTRVSLGIERAGDAVEVTITRARVRLPHLTSKLIEGDFGYIRLFGFAKGAGGRVGAEVGRLVERGATGLVLDLRDNPGGLFSEAVAVASVFIEDGDVVIYRDRDSDEVAYEAEGDAYEDVPLVVLVNEGSASASEIVAGALRDHDRATVVGTRTFGKASVQKVVTLRDSSVFKLTAAEYLTPGGTSLNGAGLEPDVVIDAAPGAQKRRAVGILRGIVMSAAGAGG